MKSNKHYPVLRRFLLESTFEEETELSLYQMFKEKHPEYEIEFEEFRRSVGPFLEDFVLLSFFSRFFISDFAV